MNESYGNFSIVYDNLMNVDYEKLCKRLLNICKKHSHKPRLALDAACGTGNLTRELIKNGIDVIGVDRSAEMLSVARKKLGSEATLICQDLSELDLYGTVDTVFCTLDSLNHITDIKLFEKAVGRMALFLEKGGLMIFDVNTVYKHKFVLGNNAFTDETDEVFMIWQNSLNENTVNIDLNFFVKQNDNSYIRLCENFDERAYTDQEINSVLKKSGLEIAEKIDFFNNENVNEKSEKIIYIVRKR